MKSTDLSKIASSQRDNKPFIVSGRGKITYGEQFRRIAWLTRWLEEKGLAKGSLILVAVDDDIEQASVLAALVATGRTPLLLDPSSTRAEIDAILGSTSHDGVVATAAIRDQWGLDGDGTPWLQVKPKGADGKVLARLLRKRATENSSVTWPSCIEASSRDELTNIEQESIAYIIFTSGTTSAPKGVEISHGALNAQLVNLKQHFGLTEDCRILNPLPIHHADGWVQGPLICWFCGCTLYRPVAFSPNHIQAFMDSVYRDRITHLISVPTMLSMMHRLGNEFRDAFESPEFRFIVSAAGHLEQPLWEEVEATFKTRVVNMYGLSETGTTALFSGPDADSREVGTIGKPVGFDIRIVKDEDDAAPGEEGELWLRGPQLMNGYHKRPQETAVVLRDGWLRTGDLVIETPSGHIKVTGRLKSLIITGGRNVSPLEVAETINAHPDVRESVVLGAPDPDWGERVAALVVPDNSSVTEAAIIDWCRGRLSEHKIPKQVLFTTQLEKGPSGKVRLDLARKQLLSIVASPGSEPGTGGLEYQVKSIAANCFRVSIESLTPNSSPTNTIGWDSLAHMELVIGLEKQLSIKLSAKEIMQIDSLSRAIEICASKQNQ